MHEIKRNHLSGWQVANSRHYPTMLQVACGKCGQFTNIGLGGVFLGSTSWMGEGSCANLDCQIKTRVVLLYNENTSQSEPVTIFVDPSPLEKRQVIQGYNLINDEKVIRAYENVVDTYNKQAYSAVPAVVGRALEGLVKQRLLDGPNTNLAIDVPKIRMLGPLLEALFANTNLLSPLQELASALKDSRNAGTHFDEIVEPDENLASKMIELLEVMIEYIYILPAQTKELRDYMDGPAL